MPARPRFPLLLATLLAMPCCRSGYQVAARATRSVPLPVQLTQAVPPQVEVQFHAGLLLLEPGERLEVSLTAELSAEDEAGLDRLTPGLLPSVVEAPTGTSLQLRLPDGGDLESLATIWRLRVPADTRIRAITRAGAVVARGCQSHLEVQGGTGILEAEMAGATAILSSTSGRIVLRGDYPFAELRSPLGRIDAEMPALASSAFELHVVGGRGDVWLDLQDGQRFELDFRGDLTLVRPDPAVRLEFLQTIDSIDRPHNRCALGDLAGLPTGRLRVEANAPVHVRRVPSAAPAGP
ncbi:MAG: hypothetical protein IPK26_07845 [Planctomycetes bacterium]|nr:hypothetical protein [Planctomycetota bacterium]